VSSSLNWGVFTPPSGGVKISPQSRGDKTNVKHWTTYWTLWQLTIFTTTPWIGLKKVLWCGLACLVSVWHLFKFIIKTFITNRYATLLTSLSVVSHPSEIGTWCDKHWRSLPMNKWVKLLVYMGGGIQGGANIWGAPIHRGCKFQWRHYFQQSFNYLIFRNRNGVGPGG